MKAPNSPAEPTIEPLGSGSVGLCTYDVLVPVGVVQAIGAHAVFGSLAATLVNAGAQGDKRSLGAQDQGQPYYRHFQEDRWLHGRSELTRAEPPATHRFRTYLDGDLTYDETLAWTGPDGLYLAIGLELGMRMMVDNLRSDVDPGPGKAP